MADLKKYWQEVRSLEKGMDDFVWLVSVQDASKGHVGGRTMQAAAAVAAKLLHGGSHRIASETEVESLLASQDADRKQAFTTRLQRQGIAVVPVAGKSDK